MKNIELKVKKVRQDTNIEMPRYMSEGASGLDLFITIDKDIILKHLERALVPTGISVSIPPGFEAQIRPRSGLAIKHGITLLNSPGTIDSDYRGEINLVVINLGNESFTLKNGMRLAQMVISKYVKIKTTLVEDIDNTKRGIGGFGHTGI